MTLEIVVILDYHVFLFWHKWILRNKWYNMLMNSIKQAKHLNDALLGRYGRFELQRSGVDNQGVYTWIATLSINGRDYTGWGTSEEEARTEAANNYKAGKWEYDYNNRTVVRNDGSRLARYVQVSDGEHWRVVQKPLQDKFVELDAKKRIITIHIDMPEPIKNMVLMTQVFKFANNKMQEGNLKLTEQQIEEFVKVLYPIFSYSDMWNDHISELELNDFYGVQHQEEPAEV
jgi:hypothetical protein